MTKLQQIEKLIADRNNGDLTAQCKIDILFDEHREETKHDRELRDNELINANRMAYGV